MFFIDILLIVHNYRSIREGATSILFMPGSYKQKKDSFRMRTVFFILWEPSI